MKYFHEYTHCHRKWRKTEAIYDLPDSANLWFFSKSGQLHGIGNVCVLTLFINSRGPSTVWLSFFFIIILWYRLPFSRVQLQMVCTPMEKVSLTGNLDITLSFWWGVISSQLSTEVFLLEELLFKSLLRDSKKLWKAKSHYSAWRCWTFGLWDINIYTYIIKNTLSSSYWLRPYNQKQNIKEIFLGFF